MGGFDPVRMWLPGPGPGRRGDLGLFPPGTVARRVNAETTLLLGGGRALLLQLAHPMVAAGVADHSDFRRDAFIRLANTLDITLTVSFGDEHQRRAAVARVTVTHQRVTGERNGRTYRALDPELLLWVHATLVDSALATYERFVGSICPVGRDRYYEEMKGQAVAFGVPEDRVPGSFEDFREYVDGMVSTLQVTDEARELSRGVLEPPSPAPIRPLVGVMRFLTAGLLPERVRAGVRPGLGSAARAGSGRARYGDPRRGCAAAARCLASLAARARRGPPASRLAVVPQHVVHEVRACLLTANGTRTSDRGL